VRVLQIERNVGQAIEKAGNGIALLGRDGPGQRLPRHRAEAGIVLAAARGADYPQIGRHKPVAVETEQRRQQHSLGQITRRTEQDERFGGDRHSSPHFVIGVAT
jgi:hypothetical protein